MMTRWAAAAAIAMATNASSGMARGVVTGSTGLSLSRGDYGERSPTTVIAVPWALTYRTSSLKLRIALPWVSIRGPASLIQTPDIGGGPGPSGASGGAGGRGGGGGPGSSTGAGSSTNSSGDIGVIEPAKAPASQRRSDIGDLVLVAITSQPLGHGRYLEPGLKLKLPTASREKRLGTGRVDLTASIDLVQELDRVTLYAGVRRKFAGRPAGSLLRSTWGAGLGASYRFGHGLLLGADYDWQQSSLAGRGSLRELTGWVSGRIARRGRLTLSLTRGLTANSADYALATGLSWRF